MKRYFSNLDLNLNKFLSETKDVEETRIYKKFKEINSLLDMHMFAQKNLPQVRNLQTYFETEVQDYEYYEEEGKYGKECKLEDMKITFDFHKYYIECYYHIWYMANIKTPTIFEFPMKICPSSQSYDNYCEINFYPNWQEDDSDNEMDEKPDILKEDLKNLFDFIHKLVMEKYEYDPFGVAFEHTDENAISCYEGYGIK